MPVGSTAFSSFEVKPRSSEGINGSLTPARRPRQQHQPSQHNNLLSKNPNDRNSSFSWHHPPGAPVHGRHPAAAYPSAGHGGLICKDNEAHGDGASGAASDGLSAGGGGISLQKVEARIEELERSEFDLKMKLFFAEEQLEEAAGGADMLELHREVAEAKRSRAQAEETVREAGTALSRLETRCRQLGAQVRDAETRRKKDREERGEAEQATQSKFRKHVSLLEETLRAERAENARLRLAAATHLSSTWHGFDDEGGGPRGGSLRRKSMGNYGRGQLEVWRGGSGGFGGEQRDQQQQQMVTMVRSQDSSLRSLRADVTALRRQLRMQAETVATQKDENKAVREAAEQVACLEAEEIARLALELESATRVAKEESEKRRIAEQRLATAEKLLNRRGRFDGDDSDSDSDGNRGDGSGGGGGGGGGKVRRRSSRSGSRTPSPPIVAKSRGWRNNCDTKNPYHGDGFGAGGNRRSPESRSITPPPPPHSRAGTGSRGWRSNVGENYDLDRGGGGRVRSPRSTSPIASPCSHNRPQTERETVRWKRSARELSLLSDEGALGAGAGDGEGDWGDSGIRGGRETKSLPPPSRATSSTIASRGRRVFDDPPARRKVETFGRNERSSGSPRGHRDRGGKADRRHPWGSSPPDSPGRADGALDVSTTSGGRRRSSWDAGPASQRKAPSSGRYSIGRIGTTKSNGATRWNGTTRLNGTTGTTRSTGTTRANGAIRFGGDGAHERDSRRPLGGRPGRVGIGKSPPRCDTHECLGGGKLVASNGRSDAGAGPSGVGGAADRGTGQHAGQRAAGTVTAADAAARALSGRRRAKRLIGDQQAGSDGGAVAGDSAPTSAEIAAAIRGEDLTATIAREFQLALATATPSPASFGSAAGFRKWNSEQNTPADAGLGSHERRQRGHGPLHGNPPSRGARALAPPGSHHTRRRSLNDGLHLGRALALSGDARRAPFSREMAELESDVQHIFQFFAAKDRGGKAERERSEMYGCDEEEEAGAPAVGDAALTEAITLWGGGAGGMGSR